MRKFFITDIHGDLKGLQLLLRQSELDWEQDRTSGWRPDASDASSPKSIQDKRTYLDRKKRKDEVR